MNQLNGSLGTPSSPRSTSPATTPASSSTPRRATLSSAVPHTTRSMRVTPYNQRASVALPVPADASRHIEFPHPQREDTTRSIGSTCASDPIPTRPAAGPRVVSRPFPSTTNPTAIVPPLRLTIPASPAPGSPTGTPPRPRKRTSPTTPPPGPRGCSPLRHARDAPQTTTPLPTPTRPSSPRPADSAAHHTPATKSPRDTEGSSRAAPAHPARLYPGLPEAVPR